MKFRRVFLLSVVLACLLLAGPSQSAAPIAMTGQYAVEAAVDVSSTDGGDYIWAGKRMTRGAAIDAPISPDPAADTLPSAVYSGTLAPIAARLGTSVKAVLNTSKLYNPGLALTGQRAAGPAARPTPTSPPPTGKWIDVDIGSQTIMAYDGKMPLKTVLMSSGLGWNWTPQGNYKVYLKVASQTMSGGIGAERYYLPNVPWILYYSGDNAIHGAYWHNNFGFPMSHGCVNISTPDAKWFYDWGQVGTPVIVHM